MAKKIKAIIKLYCAAGAANPAPPVGPALGQHGLNIMDFCKKFNEKTRGQEGLTLPVVITAYEDKSYTFVIKSPPASVLIKRACGLAKSSGLAGKEVVGALTRARVAEIAKTKMVDLNAQDAESAIKIVQGTCRSMGIKVVETEEELKDVVITPIEEKESSKPAPGPAPTGAAPKGAAKPEAQQPAKAPKEKPKK